MKRAFIITKEFHFSASHKLEGLREGHQCGRDHGHNYVVKVFLSAESLNEHGFVEDYGDLKDIKEYIDNVLDHRNLNEVLVPMQTSAENIARYLFNYFQPSHPLLTGVAVKETPKTEAYYGEVHI